jgi:hypothetical protein
LFPWTFEEVPPVKKLVSFAGVLSFALTITAHAQQVAFIGDNFIADWGGQPQFTAHSNWKDYSTVQTFEGGFLSGSGTALATLHNVIATKKPNLIVFEAGEEDMERTTPGNIFPLTMAEWATNIVAVINAAQTAKIPLILGTIPYSALGDPTAFNQWLQVYAAAHSVSVVNFGWALNHPPAVSLPSITTYFQAPANTAGFVPDEVVSPAGWNLVTDMIGTQIGLSLHEFHLTSGYLQTVVQNPQDAAEPELNGNQALHTAAVQFTAWGEYSDGKSRIINNADVNGNIGVWNSSSPQVMWIDQTGKALALEAGSSNIHFTTLSGITINEWVMFTTGNGVCNCNENW